MTVLATIPIATELARRPLARPPVRIQPVDGARDVRAWEQYAEQTRAATLFHLPTWSEVVAAVFGHQPCHLLALRGEQVVGVLPLMEVHSLLAGRLLVSVPYASHGGILADDGEARDALAAEAIRRTEADGARCLELRGFDPALSAFARECRHSTFVRALPERPRELETYLPRKARAAVRQARERERLVVRHDAEHLPTVWRLYARSMRRLGSLSYPPGFFAALAERLGERAWVTTVWQRSRPAAGLLSFVHRDTVMPYFVGVDERLHCTGVTNLLYFAVMQRAVEAGLQFFDFGRTRKTNIGPAEFKRNQGFEPTDLSYQRYVPAGSTSPNLSPCNPRFALARRLWRVLPLPLASRLGAWFSRSIPG